MIFVEWGRLCLQSKLFDSLGTRRILLLSLFTCYMVSDYLRAHGLQPTRLLCPWDSPGKGTGVGCHFPLQGIFLTQGSNPHLPSLLNWQADSLSSQSEIFH